MGFFLSRISKSITFFLRSLEYGIGIGFDSYSIPTLKCKLNLVCYNQDWVLSSLTKEGVQKEPLAEIEISLRFSADGLSGSAGCNRYFAAYQTEGDNQLSITGIATTRMFCPQPAGVMVQEQDFVQLLSEVETYRICPDQLTLDANGQKHRLVFNNEVGLSSA